GGRGGGEWYVPPDVRRIALAGGTAVPGLTDAHGHFEELGAALDAVDLTGAPSLDEVVRRVAARAAREPAGTWILGRGWDQTRWPRGVVPSNDARKCAGPGHARFLALVHCNAAI